MADVQVVLLEVDTDTAVLVEGKLTDTITDAVETSTLVVEDSDVSIIEVGIQGPAGTPGAGSAAYARRIDLSDDTIIYKGEAAPGTTDDTSAWRISRIVISDDGAVTTWANAGAFAAAWTLRATYTYE